MLGLSDKDKEQWFRAFETSKFSTKVLLSLTKHASEKNCHHTLTDILSMVLVEKVEGYMIGEDLVGAQDRELEVYYSKLSIERRKQQPQPQQEEQGQEKEGQEDNEMKTRLSNSFKSSQDFWRIIREHLEEGDNEDNGLRCTHKPFEILEQISK